MKNVNRSRHPFPAITQTQNNTTLWVGHLQNDLADHFAGQTFTCPADGILENIQVFSSAVHNPGELHLTLFEFDAATKKWGSPIGHSVLTIEKQDNDKWIQFSLPGIILKHGAGYGFRLQTHNAMIGIGEAATGTDQPFTGHEWNGDSLNERGHFYSYFSLMFKVEMGSLNIQ